jgi:hypothetical protein
MSFYLEQIFKSLDFSCDSTTMLLRHKKEGIDFNYLIQSNMFDFSQAVQNSPDFFDNKNYVLSFLGGEGKRAIFHGAYKVEGPTGIEIPENYPYPEEIKDTAYQFKLTRNKKFDILGKRLVIKWPDPINWHQAHTSEKFEIIELFPEGHVRVFEGFNKVDLSHQELSNIVDKPDPNRIWKEKLSSVKGIYHILCTQTEKQYIGSATGKQGILGRWSDYVKNGHGGNNGIKKHLKENRGAEKHFRYLILETFPKNTAKSDILKREHQLIKRFGTDKSGLNH